MRCVLNGGYTPPPPSNGQGWKEAYGEVYLKWRVLVRRPPPSNGQGWKEAYGEVYLKWSVLVRRPPPSNGQPKNVAYTEVYLKGVFYREVRPYLNLIPVNDCSI